MLSVASGTTVDFVTYFNSFSICKWKEYTSIQKVYIKGVIRGRFKITIIGVDSKKNRVVLKESIHNNDFEEDIDVSNSTDIIMGFYITAKTECIVQDIYYYGDFSYVNKKRIGIVICTYRREQYVKKTINKLMKFCSQNTSFNVLVIDNASTLAEKTLQNFKLLHNPNYGGSGGFTKGIIESILENKNDYVLLMDDDVDLDTTTLERTYSLLCSLKCKYMDSFLSGAMLRMDKPCIQHENTAYWRKIKLYSLGKGWNLSNQDTLVDNELIREYENQYAAWWYCCIPVHRIKRIGLPLPLFIKGDDMEYSIRNKQPILHMNGIGVWHEAFEKKQAPWINYFSDRNMFILNIYAANCSRWSLTVSILCRFFKRLVFGKKSDLQVMELALHDMYKGLEYITSIPADEKFHLIKAHTVTYKSNYKKIIANVLSISFDLLLRYKTIKEDYLNFRKNKMCSNEFWNNYLKAKTGK